MRQWPMGIARSESEPDMEEIATWDGKIAAYNVKANNADDIVDIGIRLENRYKGLRAPHKT